MARDVHIGVRSEVGFSFFTPTVLLAGMLLNRSGGTAINALTPPIYIVPYGTTAVTVLSEAQFLAAQDFRVTSMYVLLSNSLDAAELVNFRINVEGVDSDGLELDMTTGDLSKGATGSVTVRAGELWCISIPAKTVSDEAIVAIGLGFEVMSI